MPWADRAKILVWMWYAGMEGGRALAEVLFGKVNPSGHLPETFPVTHLECPAHCIREFPGGKSVDYKEGIFVGYRHYDTSNIEVLFPFGYGLSYTQFEFSEFCVIFKRIEEKPEVKVSLKVSNTGKADGKEVVQIYVGKQESAVERPKKVLAAFAKVELKAGESVCDICQTTECEL